MSKLEQLWQEIETQRDELRVQMHLARAELKDEWEELEKKWPAAEAKLKHFTGEVEGGAEDLQQNLKVVGEEIKAAYARIRTRIKEDADD